MPRWLASVAACCLVVAALAAFSTATVAQDATPLADLDVPAPAECRVAPVPVARLRQGAATPIGGTPVGDAATPFAPPVDTAADAATTEAVTATVREAIACANAGNLLRGLALASDSYRDRFVAGLDLGRFDERSVDLLATPEPPLDGQALLGVRDVQFLADGRVGLVVTTADDPSEVVPRERYVLLVASAGRWLIDDVIALAPVATPTP